MSDKFSHEEWPGFNSFWRVLLYSTRSCFERDVLRDCKDLLWDRWLALSSGELVLRPMVPDIEHSEWAFYSLFFTRGLQALQLDPCGTMCFRCCEFLLWERWKLRAGVINKRVQRRGY